MSQQTSKSTTGNEMPSYWDDQQVDHFITSEAHTKKKTPEQFRETHVDIDRIQADFLTPLGISDEFVTQEDVLNAITASHLEDPNRIFILRGEPGSGKSQLCEWVKYQINGCGESDEGMEDRVALHVSRSQTQMDQILDVLTEPLDVDPDVRNIEGSEPYDLANPIVGLLRGYWSTELLSDEELEELTAERDDGTDLRDIFAENISDYQEALSSRDENPEFNLITRSDYRELHLSLSSGKKLRDNKEIIFPALKKQAHEYLSKNLVGDFKEQLQEYSELYQDKDVRPTLICEDLTTFSVLKEQLLDHIFELSSSSYDIVLGWTIGWEQDNIDDALARQNAAKYMEGRSEGKLTLTDEKGEAFFLDDDASVALARSYLDAIKRNSDIESAPEEVEEAFDNLYPFNERFIHVAFRQLNDEGSSRKTPRLLLLRVVKHCLKSSWPPYEAMKSNSFVDTPMLEIDATYDQIYRDISRWYGVELDNGIGVKTEVLDTFGIPFSESDNISVKNEYAIFEKGQWSGLNPREKPPVPDHQVDEKPEEDDENEDEDVSKEGKSDDDKQDSEEDKKQDELTDEQRERQRKIQEFQDWVTSGESYPSSDTLHDGAVATLERWHEPTRLSNPNASTRSVGGIYFARGDSIPVSIQGDQQRQASIDIELEWGSDNADLYTTILKFGLYEVYDPQTANFDQLRAWADTNVAQFKHEMREEIENCLPSELDIEKTLVLAQCFLINSARGVEFEDGGIPPELVFEEYDSNQPYGKPVSEHFDRDSAFGQAFSDLTMSSSDISDLIEGLFLLKKNVVDYERLSEARREISNDPQAYVDAALTIDTADLADAYKVGTTRNKANTKLSSLLDRISDYAAELDRLTVEEDASHIQEALEPVERWYDSSHTVDDLAEWFETLYECAGAVDVPIKPSYENAYETLTESPEEMKLSAFIDDVEQFQNMEDTTGMTLIVRLHDFARSQHEQDAWDIYEAFDSLIEDLQEKDHATGADLEHRIKQLSEYSDYEQKRQKILSVTEDL
jgi:hypothetical protein